MQGGGGEGERSRGGGKGEGGVGGVRGRRGGRREGSGRRQNKEVNPD